MPVANAEKVFLSHPSARLIRMSAACPSPKGLEDRSIYRAKGAFAAHMPVVVRPAPDHRVKLDDQIAGFGLCVTLDDLSDFSQERFYIAGRRGDDDFSIVMDFHS